MVGRVLVDAAYTKHAEADRKELKKNWKKK
jgi:hypothetical protein